MLQVIEQVYYRVLLAVLLFRRPTLLAQLRTAFVRPSARKTLGIPPETVLAHLRYAPSGGKESPTAARYKKILRGLA
ncbi:MAG: hypothetical protein J2P36_10805, partial [Ktedonobacteraceae bacterium]|nr:hypothetical protein [Ktedonobacteraceae bacterium]